MKTSFVSADSALASDTTTPMMYPQQRAHAAVDAVNDRRWGQGLRTLRNTIARVMHTLRSLGPYVAIELLLPGGTIIALGLWAYRHFRAARGSVAAASPEVAPAEPRVPLCSAALCPQR